MDGHSEDIHATVVPGAHLSNHYYSVQYSQQGEIVGLSPPPLSCTTRSRTMKAKEEWNFLVSGTMLLEFSMSRDSGVWHPHNRSYRLRPGG